MTTIKINNKTITIANKSNESFNYNNLDKESLTLESLALNIEKSIEALNIVSNIKAMESFGYKSTEGVGENIKAGIKNVWEKIKQFFEKLRIFVKKIIGVFFKRKKKLICTTKDIDEIYTKNSSLNNTVDKSENNEPELRQRTNEEKREFIYHNRNVIIQVYGKYNLIQNNGGIDYFKKCENACDKYIEIILKYIDNPKKIKDSYFEEFAADAKRIGELVQNITMFGRKNFENETDNFGKRLDVDGIDITDKNRISELLKSFIENTDNIYNTFSSVANCIDSINNKMKASIFNGNTNKKLQSYSDYSNEKYNSIINRLYYTSCTIYQWSYGVSNELLNNMKNYNSLIDKLNALIDPNKHH